MGWLIKLIRRAISIFFIPPLIKIVQRDLEEAQRELLSAERSFDHASATVILFEERCSRLKRQLEKLKNQEGQ